jgi:serine protease Do
VVQNITPEIARHLNIKDTKGVIVTDIQQGSPADEADVRAGDIIREINRKPVRNVDDFRGIVGKARPKDGVVMLVKRENMTFYAVMRNG